MIIAPQESEQFGPESGKVQARDAKWMEYMQTQNLKRRSLNDDLQPGSVDVHIHLDIDGPMKRKYGSAYAAARYAVELFALVNRDAYWDLGFNLKVVSINVRNGNLASQASTSAYMRNLEKIAVPDGVSLMHSVTSRRIGGGLAYIGGLYSGSAFYGVSGSIKGQFAFWDRFVIAHELGHNFGAPHTHEMSPPVDRCGISCPRNPIGTIMSYCHGCSGGMRNNRFRWAPRIREVMLDTYHLSKHRMRSRTACKLLQSETPDIGVPFYFKGSECLHIDTGSCPDCDIQTCTSDSTFQFDGSRLRSTKNGNFCWRADPDCNSVSLQRCNNWASQRFSFENGRIVSQICGEMKFQGSTVTVGDEGSPISRWCHQDSDETLGGPGSCSQPVESVSCGDILTGSTTDSCNGEVQFDFIGQTEYITISTCGSDFDTELSIKDSNQQQIASGDDEGNCGVQTVLEGVPISVDAPYTISLSGFAGWTGNFQLELTCHESLPTTTSPSTTLSSGMVGIKIETEGTGSGRPAAVENLTGIGDRLVITSLTTILSDSCGANTWPTISFSSSQCDIYEQITHREAIRNDQPTTWTELSYECDSPVDDWVFSIENIDGNCDHSYYYSIVGYIENQLTTTSTTTVETTSTTTSPLTTTTSETATTTLQSTTTATTSASLIRVAEFSSRSAMEADGWNFSGFSNRALLSRPSNFCRNVPATSYCGFLNPGDLALTYTFEVSGDASLNWGYSWHRGLVVVSLNGEQIASRNTRGSEITEFTVSAGDTLEIKEVSASVINIHELIISPNMQPSASSTTSSQPTSTTTTSAINSHYVACGRPNRCSGTQASQDSVLRKVRCVSDNWQQNWFTNSRCDTWWASNVWGTCQTLNYHDAVSFCASHGARLPTVAEAESGCVANSGCGYDGRLIWTSTPV